MAYSTIQHICPHNSAGVENLSLLLIGRSKVPGSFLLGSSLPIFWGGEAVRFAYFYLERLEVRCRNYLCLKRTPFLGNSKKFVLYWPSREKWNHSYVFTFKLEMIWELAFNLMVIAHKSVNSWSSVNLFKLRPWSLLWKEFPKSLGFTIPFSK